MKYAFIERNRRHWPASVLCELLGVSPSGYHQHKQRQASTEKPRRGGVSDDSCWHISRRFMPRSKGNMAGHACGRNSWHAACRWARSVCAS
ncbi:protein of unknown function (plasmid) [Cupriavidus taiwanensis]|uniref:Uncharacterized protein n=1 Tax=Cupriavidus taiwanensis TaxID=164546 RepID=A0A375EDX8_9BURK|nr:protein of unknown function [Cupriavidus taiwanensis]SOZ72342.1 protein of unknown function [Cupriavidus taiwanensis]SOZ74644.1 protein of unknown function [Cupriavidus taiwanensis]SPA03548.1 protein of unknown function [Cupriavidus taiwanensis]SPA11447.1 protein of unknown function [Cupriavidus taiwanensis]